MLHISSDWLNVLPRTFSAMLNINGECDILPLYLVLEESLSFSPLNMKLAVDNSYFAVMSLRQSAEEFSFL